MGEANTLITAEALYRLGNDRRLELVRGELLELPFNGYLHGVITGRLLMRLWDFVHERGLGECGVDLGCILARNPDTVRGPDCSFIAAGRLAADAVGFFEGAPDLAVEVLMPDDRASEIQQRTREYLEAGTRLVWIVDPQTNTVTVFAPSGAAHVYSGQDAVPGGDVLSGFSLSPAELFRQKL